MKLDIRKQVIQNYLKLAKEKCPFTDEDLINGYIEGFLDCAEMFELKDYYNLNYNKNETDVIKIIKPLREGNIKRASKSKIGTKKPNIRPSPQKR